MRAVGKEQFVAFSLHAVAVTAASLGLKRFGATAEIILISAVWQLCQRTWIEMYKVKLHAIQATLKWIRPFLIFITAVSMQSLETLKLVKLDMESLNKLLFCVFGTMCLCELWK